MKIQNALHTITYDGDLLSYRCSKVAGYIFGILRWTKYFEIPVNTIIHQESKSMGFLRLTSFYIHHYSYSRKRLTPKRIRHVPLLSLNQKKVNQLFTKLDRIIAQNLMDEMNLGLKHISKTDRKLFYIQLNRQSVIQTTGEIPLAGMANMHPHKTSQAS